MAGNSRWIWLLAGARMDYDAYLYTYDSLASSWTGASCIGFDITPEFTALPHPVLCGRKAFVAALVTGGLARRKSGDNRDRQPVSTNSLLQRPSASDRCWRQSYAMLWRPNGECWEAEWLELPRMNVPRASHAAAVFDGHIVVVGGNGRDTAETYPDWEVTMTSVEALDLAPLLSIDGFRDRQDLEMRIAQHNDWAWRPIASLPKTQPCARWLHSRAVAVNGHLLVSLAQESHAHSTVRFALPRIVANGPDAAWTIEPTSNELELYSGMPTFAVPAL